MPVGSEIRHLGLQSGVLCVWVEVEDGALLTTEVFYVVGTGHIVPNNVTYIGTVQMEPFVWHVFRERR